MDPCQPELPLGLAPATAPTSGLILRHDHWWFLDTRSGTPRGPFLTEAAAQLAYTAHCERIALAGQVPHSVPALRVTLTPEGHLELSGDGARTVIPICADTGRQIQALLQCLAAPAPEPRHYHEANSLGTIRRIAPARNVPKRSAPATISLSDLGLE